MFYTNQSFYNHYYSDQPPNYQGNESSPVNEQYYGYPNQLDPINNSNYQTPPQQEQNQATKYLKLTPHCKQLADYYKWLAIQNPYRKHEYQRQANQYLELANQYPHQSAQPQWLAAEYSKLAAEYSKLGQSAYSQNPYQTNQYLEQANQLQGYAAQFSRLATPQEQPMPLAIPNPASYYQQPVQYQQATQILSQQHVPNKPAPQVATNVEKNHHDPSFIKNSFPPSLNTPLQRPDPSASTQKHDPSSETPYVAHLEKQHYQSTSFPPALDTPLQRPDPSASTQKHDPSSETPYVTHLEKQHYQSTSFPPALDTPLQRPDPSANTQKHDPSSETPYVARLEKQHCQNNSFPPALDTPLQRPDPSASTQKHDPSNETPYVARLEKQHCQNNSFPPALDTPLQRPDPSASIQKHEPSSETPYVARLEMQYCQNNSFPPSLDTPPQCPDPSSKAQKHDPSSETPDVVRQMNPAKPPLEDRSKISRLVRRNRLGSRQLCPKKKRNFLGEVAIHGSYAGEDIRSLIELFIIDGIYNGNIRIEAVNVESGDNKTKQIQELIEQLYYETDNNAILKIRKEIQDFLYENEENKEFKILNTEKKFIFHCFNFELSTQFNRKISLLFHENVKKINILSKKSKGHLQYTIHYNGQIGNDLLQSRVDNIRRSQDWGKFNKHFSEGMIFFNPYSDNYKQAENLIFSFFDLARTNLSHEGVVIMMWNLARNDFLADINIHEIANINGFALDKNLAANDFVHYTGFRHTKNDDSLHRAMLSTKETDVSSKDTDSILVFRKKDKKGEIIVSENRLASLLVRWLRQKQVYPRSLR